MKELQIVKELQDLIPPLTKEEYNLLEQSILNEGVRDPIIIWGDMIVDGHNRYNICKKHNIKFKTIDREFIDLDEVKIFIIENQLGRRNISKFVRGELALDLADIKSVEALKKKSEEMKKLNEEKWKTWREENETPVGKAISKVLDEHKTKKRNYAKPNKIYIVLDKQNDKIKIGCSKYPEERVKETILKHIPDATIMYIFNGDISIEKEIHRELDEYRLHQEWFRYDESNKNDVEKVLDLYRSVQTDRIDALQYASEISNVGRTSISKIKKIKEKASEEDIQKLRRGEISINEVHKEIKRVENQTKRINEQIDRDNSFKEMPLPNRKYSVLYVDPPWQYEYSKSHSREIENNYPTMELDKIKTMDINKVVDDNCVIFMWATSPKLSEAIEVLEAWDFTYKTCAVWVKDKIGMGYYFRQQHELLLVATKGNPVLSAPTDRISSVLEYPRGKHSAKPVELYDIIDNMYPGIIKLELFSRGNDRENWMVWGYESK